MSIREPHGGYCCGMEHRRSFPFAIRGRAAYFESEIRHAAELQANSCQEIVLTDGQMNITRAKLLKKNGYRFFTRFRNSNSSNYCNVFHRLKDDYAKQEKIVPWMKVFAND